MDLGAVRREFVDQGRGVTGALLVIGTSMLYTMEMTWLGRRLPPAVLLSYTVVGMGLVLVATKYVGFRASEDWETDRSTASYVTDFTELLMQSFLTAYAVLFLFGFVGIDDPPLVVVRLGLIFVVPLAFGASIANQLLGTQDGGGNGGSDGGGGSGDGRGGGGNSGESGGSASHGSGDGATRNRSFARDLVIYTAGAVFISAAFAPTEEIPLIATTAGWPRLFATVVASVLVAHLILFELEFRGHEHRVGRESERQQWGTTFTLYFISVVVAVLLLAAFGQVPADRFAVVVQEVIVLAFPASIGASGATVVLS